MQLDMLITMYKKELSYHIEKHIIIIMLAIDNIKEIMKANLYLALLKLIIDYIIQIYALDFGICTIYIY
jgi:hypothetical protein